MHGYLNVKLIELIWNYELSILVLLGCLLHILATFVLFMTCIVEDSYSKIHMNIR